MRWADGIAGLARIALLPPARRSVHLNEYRGESQRRNTKMDGALVAYDERVETACMSPQDEEDEER